LGVRGRRCGWKLGEVGGEVFLEKGAADGAGGEDGKVTVEAAPFGEVVG